MGPSGSPTFLPRARSTSATTSSTPPRSPSWPEARDSPHESSSGFAPDPESPGSALDGTLRGDAVRAWPEIAFDTADGIVWVPFDPTPTDDPQQLNVVRPETPLPAPQPLPPPPPTRTSTQILPDDLADPDREEEPDGGFVIPREVWIAMGALGSVLLVVGLPIAVIVALKVWRRRRRRRGRLTTRSPVAGARSSTGRSTWGFSPRLDPPVSSLPRPSAHQWPWRSPSVPTLRPSGRPSRSRVTQTPTGRTSRRPAAG